MSSSDVHGWFRVNLRQSLVCGKRVFCKQLTEWSSERERVRHLQAFQGKFVAVVWVAPEGNSSNRTCSHKSDSGCSAVNVRLIGFQLSFEYRHSSVLIVGEKLARRLTMLIYSITIASGKLWLSSTATTARWRCMMNYSFARCPMIWPRAGSFFAAVRPARWCNLICNQTIAQQIGINCTL